MSTISYLFHRRLWDVHDLERFSLKLAKLDLVLDLGGG